MHSSLPGVYLAYTALVVGTALWMGARLVRHAHPLMRGLFGGDANMARAANQLVTIGLLLLLVGILALCLPADIPIASSEEALDFLIVRAALVLFVSALAFFLRLRNLFAIFRRRGRSGPPAQPASLNSSTQSIAPPRQPPVAFEHPAAARPSLLRTIGDLPSAGEA